MKDGLEAWNIPRGESSLEENIDRRNFPIKVMAASLREEIEVRYKRANSLFHPPVIIATSSIERKIQVKTK